MSGELSPPQRLAANRGNRGGKQPAPRVPRKVVWATRLVAIREELGLARNAVATAVGIPPAMLAHAEYGCDLCLRNAAAIAEFYGLSIGEIWTKRVSAGAKGGES